MSDPKAHTPLKGTSLFGQANSAEDAMRIAGVRTVAKDRHEKNMYYDAALRVVFRNCMTQCDLTDENLPNFNSNFYYNMKNEQ